MFTSTGVRTFVSATTRRCLAAVSFNLGPLALQYILDVGGCGYFRRRVVQSYVDSGLLEWVEQAPEFTYPVYLVYPRERSSTALHQALDTLRQVAGTDSDWSQRWDPMI